MIRILGFSLLFCDHGSLMAQSILVPKLYVVISTCWTAVAAIEKGQNWEKIKKM
jgi:hypothetical protein